VSCPRWTVSDLSPESRRSSIDPARCPPVIVPACWPYGWASLPVFVASRPCGRHAGRRTGGCPDRSAPWCRGRTRPDMGLVGGKSSAGSWSRRTVEDDTHGGGLTTAAGSEHTSRLSVSPVLGMNTKIAH
jgi:hypothetical protein